MLVADLASQSPDCLRRRRQQTPNLTAAPAATVVAAPATASVGLQKIKKRAPGVLKACPQASLADGQESQLAAMLLTARSLGYVCQRGIGVQMDLAEQIYSRMTNRQGKDIYQQVIFSMPLAREAATLLFPAHMMKEEQEVLFWTSENLQDARVLIAHLLSCISNNTNGLTRAIQPPSESVARVFAVLMPTIEIKHVILSHGAERLHFKQGHVRPVRRLRGECIHRKTRRRRKW